MEYLLEIWADDETKGNWTQILENSMTFFLIVGARGIRFMQEKNLRKKFGENTLQTCKSYCMTNLRCFASFHQRKSQSVMESLNGKVTNQLAKRIMKSSKKMEMKMRKGTAFFKCQN